MPESKTSPRDRARFAELARLATQTAVAVGDAIAIRDMAIVTRKRGRANFATAAEHVAEAFAVASLGCGETKKKDSRFTTLNATCARLRVIGSAGIEISYLAMGRFDLFVHSALSPWDVAAPALIAREAVATVLSLKTGKDAAWNERQVVIANPRLAKDAVKLLAKPRI